MMCSLSLMTCLFISVRIQPDVEQNQFICGLAASVNRTKPHCCHVEWQLLETEQNHTLAMWSHSKSRTKSHCCYVDLQ